MEAFVSDRLLGPDWLCSAARGAGYCRALIGFCNSGQGKKAPKSNNLSPHSLIHLGDMPSVIINFTSLPLQSQFVIDNLSFAQCQYHSLISHTYR